MKRLLVPTDFSSASDRAVDFAIMLADKLNAEILFLHAYDFPNADPFDPAYLYASSVAGPVDLDADQRKLIEAQLEKYCDYAARKSDNRIFCDYLSAAGVHIDELIATLESLDDSMVIMGTRGHNPGDDILIGSNAARMVEKSPVPVIVVPRGAGVSPLKEVVYASALMEGDIRPLKLLTEILKPFDSNLHVIHIEKVIDREDVDVLEAYQEIVQDHIHYPKITFALVSGDNVIDRINEYAREVDASMVAMLSERRGGLFHKSLSKEMVFHTGVPLMVFHHG